MVVTFVTSSDPSSVGDLDNARLNKQCVEANQILDTLLGKSKGWSNHPAVLMWRGHTDALKVYINNCIRQWIRRGKRCDLQEYEIDEDTVQWPWWYTWPLFHLSHKCSLLRKKPEYYASRFTLTPDEKRWMDHGYIWPSKLPVIDIMLSYEPEQVCVPIGAGAPAQYRWTREDTERWNANRLVNPRTGRAIKAGAKTGIYRDIEKAYNYYQANK